MPKKPSQLPILIPLFAANTISGFAQGITMLAIPWYLIQIPNGKFLNASMVAIVTLLSMFWGVYAGTLIDKYNRKHLFMGLTAIDAVILCTVSSIGFFMGNVPFPLIALIFTTTIFTYNVHYPNLYALVQELFDRDSYAKVNSALEVQGQTTNFLGMMVGGILIGGSQGITWWPDFLAIEPWSLQEIFLMDGLTYIISFFLISQIPYDAKKREAVDEGSLLKRVRLGFEYLLSEKAILTFGIASYTVFFSLLVYIQAISPIYVKDWLHETAIVLSSFKGVYALGAISAGLLGLAPWIKKDHPIQLIIFLEILAASIYFALANMASVAFLLGAAYLLGISNAGIRILRITYLVKIVPNRVIGRVNSFFNIVNVMMRVSFLSMLAIPFFAKDENGANIVFALGVLGVIIGISAAVLFVLREKFPKVGAKEVQQDIA
ncbi:MAG: MFS transporter [Bacteroidia bacterium]|nr:MFS transporter [Bacteroidia bacterium]